LYTQTLEAALSDGTHRLRRADAKLVAPVRLAQTADEIGPVVILRERRGGEQGGGQ
jgi:hypothetical protein